MSPHLAAHRRIESDELVEHGRAPLRQDGLSERLEHRAQSPDDLDRRRAVLADLGHAEREVVDPASDGQDEPLVVVRGGPVKSERSV